MTPDHRELSLIKSLRAQQGNEAPDQSLGLSHDWLRQWMDGEEEHRGSEGEIWHYVQSVSGGHWNVIWPDRKVTMFVTIDDPRSGHRIAVWQTQVAPVTKS